MRISRQTVAEAEAASHHHGHGGGRSVPGLGRARSVRSDRSQKLTQIEPDDAGGDGRGKQHGRHHLRRPALRRRTAPEPAGAAVSRSRRHLFRQPLDLRHVPAVRRPRPVSGHRRSRRKTASARGSSSGPGRFFWMARNSEPSTWKATSLPFTRACPAPLASCCS